MRSTSRLFLILLALAGLAWGGTAFALKVGFHDVQSNSVGTATSITVTVPADLKAGDLLIAQVATRGTSGGSSAPTITANAAWTLIREDANASSPRLRQALYYRRVTLTEAASYQWSFSSSAYGVAAILAYRGVVLTGNPINVSGAQTASSSANVTAPSVTTTVADTMIVALFSKRRGTRFTPPSGMVERFDTRTGSSSGDLGAMAADLGLASVGASGSKTATPSDTSGDYVVGQTLALAPESAVPAPVAHYRLDETSWTGAAPQAADASGNGLHGTRQGDALAAPSAGVLCGAGHFNSVTAGTGYVEAANNARLNIRSTLTVTAWIKASSLPASDLMTYVSKDENYEAHVTPSGQVNWWWTNASGSSPELFTAGGVVATGGWYFVALVFTRSTQTLYVGTQSVAVSAGATGTDTQQLAQNTDPLQIADDQSFTGRRWRGYIDDVRIYDYALTQSEVETLRTETNTCAAGIDGFSVDIGAGTASTCAAHSVTVTALNSGGTTLTSYTGTVNLSTSTGRGDWTLVSGNGSVTNGTADDGAATYTYVAGDNGVATFGLTHQLAQQVTVTVVDSASAPTSTTSSAISFSDNTFVFTEDLSGTIAGTDVAVAGRSHDYQVALYRRDPTTATHCSIATSYNGSKSLKAWITRSGTDPAGTAPTISAVSLGNSQPGANNVSLTFSSGVATFDLGSTDVGKFAINFRDDTTTGLTAAIAGSSNELTVRPFALVVSAIQRGATANPNVSAATGTVFTQAGESFQATVAGYLHSSAADSDDDGLPDAAATLAQTTGGGLAPHYAYATTLSAAAAYTPATGTLGTLANGALSAGAFSGGGSTPATLSYSEVGSFTLALAVSNYLGSAGVNLTGTVFNAAGAQNAVVGRFTPYDFGVSLNTPEFTPGCGSNTAFTYIGQPFVYGTAPVITLTARNKAGATTRNYTGTWWKISNTTLTGRSYTAASGALDTTGLPATSSDPAIADLGGAASGQGTLTFSAGTGLSFTRAAPVAPFDAEISVALNVLDADGISYVSNPARFGAATAGNGIAFSGTGGGKPMRWGRLKLTNAMGTEFTDLLMPAEAQYYNGTHFMLNGDDGCTSFAKSAVSFNTFQRNLAACETFLSTTVPSVTLSGGKATLTLTKPGSGNTGSVDIKPGLASSDAGTSCVSATSSAVAGTAAGVNLTYLRSNWDPLAPTAYDKNPAGRAVFGIPRVPREVIFSRENY